MLHQFEVEVLKPEASWKHVLHRNCVADGVQDLIYVAFGGPEIHETTAQNRPAAQRCARQEDAALLLKG